MLTTPATDTDDLIVVPVRCEVGPKELLTEIEMSGEPLPLLDNRLLICLPCRWCTRQARKIDSTVSLVIHKINFTGQIVESQTTHRSHEETSP